MANKVYGIDLGTTYSAIAYIDDFNKAETIRNSDNEQVTPSVVFFESPENIIVGKIAKESAKSDPEQVVDYVKRQMGTDWTFAYEGRDYKPEEISSYILKRLAGDAQKTDGHDVKDVVITCPAYFGDAERNSTRQAGEIAGLNVLAILDEPAAAALHYAFRDGMKKEGASRTALVYDLGGGTFDVTVVSIENNDIRIVCTDGDHRLGGKDWDDRIIKDFMSDFENEQGVSSEDCNWDDPETSYELRLSAENAKKTLTNRESVKVRVICDAGRVNVDYARERFEESTSDLLERTIEFTRNVLAMAKEKGVDRIDDFLLVGGSTRMPMVAARIEQEFAEELGCVPQSFDVDEAVAKGAAWLGYCQNIKVLLDDKAKAAGKESFDALTDDEKKDVAADVAAEQGVADDYVLEASNTNITTVATKSYGVGVLNKEGTPIVHNMIVRQTPTPVVETQSFPTKDAGAELIELRLFSSNSSEVDIPLEEAEEIGFAELNLPPGLPARTMVEVVFELSPEGALILKGSAAGSEVRAEFKAETGMNADEVQEAKERSKDLLVE